MTKDTGYSYDVDSLRPDCPLCGNKATTSEIIFDYGPATCEPCGIQFQWYWYTKQATSGSITKLEKKILNTLVEPPAKS